MTLDSLKNKSTPNYTYFKEYIKKHKFICSLFCINAFIVFLYFSFSPQDLVNTFLKQKIGYSNIVRNHFFRHIYIATHLSLIFFLITLTVIETKIAIDFGEFKHRELDSNNNLLYFFPALTGIILILFFPWKYISPILTIFTSVLIPIALMNKESPKTSTNTSSTASKRTDELANNNVSNMEFKNTTKETKKKNSMDSNTQKGKKWVSNVSKVSFVVFTFSLSASIITPIWGHSINNFNELISLLSISAMVFSFISFVAAKIYSTL